MKFVALIRNGDETPIDVKSAGKFFTSELGATVRYDFTNGLCLDIPEQHFDKRDIKDLMQFLKFALEYADE